MQATRARALGQEVPVVPDYQIRGSLSLGQEDKPKPAAKEKAAAGAKPSSSGSSSSKPQKKSEEVGPEKTKVRVS